MSFIENLSISYVYDVLLFNNKRMEAININHAIIFNNFDGESSTLPSSSAEVVESKVKALVSLSLQPDGLLFV